jgi:hypothetical protein
MKSSSNIAATLVGLALLGSASAAYDRYAPIRTNITWASCGQNATAEYQCGEYDAPLDYNDPSVGKAIISVIKYPAQAEPRLGSIFINPGRHSIRFFGARYHRMYEPRLPL